MSNMVEPEIFFSSYGFCETFVIFLSHLNFRQIQEVNVVIHDKSGFINIPSLKSNSLSSW